MTTSLDVLPAWATDMRDRFRSGSAAEFILHGNVFDVLPSGGKPPSVARALTIASS